MSRPVYIGLGDDVVEGKLVAANRFKLPYRRLQPDRENLLHFHTTSSPPALMTTSQR